MALDFGILQPVNISGQMMAGQQQAQQNQLAQQQLKQSQMQTQQSQMQMEQLQRDRDALAKLQQQFVANGKSPDLEENFSAMIQSGIPHFVDIGTQGLQKIQQQKQFATIVGGETRPSAAPAAAQMAPGVLGSGTFDVNAPVAPINALAPAPVVSAASTNALGSAPTSDMQTRIAAAYQLGTPAALAWAKGQEERTKPLTLTAGSSVYNPQTGAFTQAPAAIPTPTDVKKLLTERDALPPGNPARAIYDQQIKDLGATAQNARARLAFDQQKFAWEKANPGHELIQNADGEYYAVNKRTNAMTPLMVGGGAAPAAVPVAPMGGGQGARGVFGAEPAGGVPVGRAAAPAGVPFVGKSAGLTESQSNAALFGSGMAQAQNVLTQASKKGVDTAPVTTSVVQGIVKYVPFGVGDKLVQDVMSVAQQDPTKLFGPDIEQQKIGQAQLAFAIAYLRKTSGAAFGPSELVNTMNEYFPSIGEDKSMIQQKAKARERVVEGMKLAAGTQGSKFIQQYQGEPGGAAAPSANDPLGLRK